MKKHVLRTLCLAFVLALCLPIVACNAPMGGLLGELAENKNTEPSQENGTEQNTAQTQQSCELEMVFAPNGQSYEVAGIGSFTGTDLVIPETYNGLPVTAILNSAFAYCTQLTSVQLPENLRIDDFAFLGCTGLKHVTIPKGTTGLTRAFDACTGLESATILTTSYNQASYIFLNCNNLTHLEFGSDVYINAYYWTLGLVSIGTVDEWYNAGNFIIVEPIYSYDADGNHILDENGQEIILFYNVLERLPITTITGGILAEGAGLVELPSLATLENYTVDGECMTVDGVLIGRPVTDEPSARNYNIWWTDPKLTSINTASLTPYMNSNQIDLYSFAHCSDLTMIKTDSDGIFMLHGATQLPALTDIYYAGSIVEYLDNDGPYFGDGVTIRCDDGVITKELGAAITCWKSAYSGYKELHAMYSPFLVDLSALAEHWKNYNTLLASYSEAQYESYAEYAEAAEGTNEYALYQEYLNYRIVKSRYNTSRNRRINDLVNMYRYWDSIQELGIDLPTAIDQFINTTLPMLESLYGCTVEYEQGKQGDLSAVTNLNQLPNFVKERVKFFASLQVGGIPKTPDEAYAIFEDALNAAINTGAITKEDVYKHLGIAP